CSSHRKRESKADRVKVSPAGDFSTFLSVAGIRRLLPVGSGFADGRGRLGEVSPPDARLDDVRGGDAAGGLHGRARAGELDLFERRPPAVTARTGGRGPSSRGR